MPDHMIRSFTLMENPETAPPLGKSKRKSKKSLLADENPLETQATASERQTVVPAVDEPKSSPATPLPKEGKTEIGKAESRSEKLAHSVTVSDAAWERLQSQTEQSFWKIETLLDQIIRDALHSAYPAITYGELCLAKAGLFRSFDRLNYRPAMLMKSDQGEYLLRVRPENPDYVRWCDIYQQRGETAAETKAAEMAVFLLQQRLQELPLAGTVHAVYPDDFIIERVLQPAAH
jgi:hypothetical protein